MNDDFAAIESILAELRSQYASRCRGDVDDPTTQIAERDIVADIRHSLMAFCSANGFHVHCEIRPAPDTSIEPDRMKRLPRVDVVVLRNSNGEFWLAAAKELQDKHQEGPFQARFSSVPVKFFHTAVEAKIQSNLASARKDIDTLKRIQECNPSCNCFFALLNARGRVRDHDRILAYGRERGVAIVEYTARRHEEKLT